MVPHYFSSCVYGHYKDHFLMSTAKCVYCYIHFLSICSSNLLVYDFFESKILINPLSSLFPNLLITTCTHTHIYMCEGCLYEYS